MGAFFEYKNRVCDVCVFFSPRFDGLLNLELAKNFFIWRT